MRLPIEVHNKLIPFKGFSWVTWLLWGQKNSAPFPSMVVVF